MAISLVSAGGLATSTTASVAPAFGQSTTLGNLLVCCAVSGTNTAFSITGPSGWVNITAAGQSLLRSEIWYKPNCAAGETAPTVNCAAATFMAAEVAEWVGGASAPLDASGNVTASSQVAVTTGGSVSGGGGGLAISVYGIGSVSGSGTWTPGVGWTVLANDLASVTFGHFASDYLLNPPTQATLSESATVGVLTVLKWSACIATFLPADVPITYGRGAN